MSERDAVHQRHQGFLASFATENYAEMHDFITDDHVGMPPNRPRLVGRDQVDAFWREGFEIAKPTIRGTPAVERALLLLRRFTDSLLDGGIAHDDEGPRLFVRAGGCLGGRRDTRLDHPIRNRVRRKLADAPTSRAR